jgi:peptide/nickel transport system substrate-binding protein
VSSVVEKAAVLAHGEAGDLGNAWLRRHAAGSGPYRLRLWRPADHLTLDADAAHWAGAPRNRRIVLRHVAEPSSQRLLLERGDVDIARNLTRDQILALAGRTDIAVQRRRKATLVYLALNQDHPALRDPEVVTALKALVDYDGIARNLLAPGYEIHQTIVPDGVPFASRERPFALAPDTAGARLAKAGFGNGLHLTIDVRNAPPFIDIAQAIQASWAASGIRLEILPADSKQLLTKYRARRHEAALVDWSADYLDANANAGPFVLNDDDGADAADRNIAWRNHFVAPGLATRVRAAAAERDPARRAALYREIQHQVAIGGPYVVMFQQVELVARRAAIDGFVLGATPDGNRYAGIHRN